METIEARPLASEAARVRAQLRLEMMKRTDADLLPYEGQWLTHAQVERKIVEERRRARVHAVELLLLYLFGLGLSLLILGLLRGFLG